MLDKPLPAYATFAEIGRDIFASSRKVRMVFNRNVVILDSFAE